MPSGEELHVRATELDFVQLLRKIVAQDPDTQIVAELPGYPSHRVDLLFLRGKDMYVVEAKRSLPQTLARLDATCTQLQELGHAFSRSRYDVHLVLAVAGSYARSRMDFVAVHGIALWDAEAIARKAEKVGLGAEAREFLSGTSSPFRPIHADELRSGLRSIPPGRNAWFLYQKHCSEVFEFLFCPALEVPYIESTNESRVNRRDFIMGNYAPSGFWSFMRERYRADHVVVETKNLVGPVEKNHVLQLCNYLTFHGLGLFGMIVSRRSENAGAAYTRREQWILHNKMTIVLEDGDLMQMLEDKKSGGDPTALIRQKIEDFRRRM